MKRFLIIAAIAVMVISMILSFLLLRLDEDRVRDVLVTQVSNQTGRDLEVRGNLHWRLFPWLGIEAQDVRLSNPPDFDGPFFLEAGSLRASVRLIPLLRGEVQLGNLHVENAVLRLLLDSAGRSNLEGLVPDRVEEDEPAEVPKFTTGRIALTDLTLESADAVRGTSDRFHIESLELDRFDFDRPLDLRFRGSVGDPVFAESIDLQASLTIPSGPGEIRMDGMSFSAILSDSGLPVRSGGDLHLDRGPPLIFGLADGRLELDDQPLELELSYEGGDRPRVNALLQGRRLDLDRILGQLPGSEDPVGTEGEGDHALAFLRHMDLDATLELDELIVGGLETREVEAVARSRDGVLVISPLSGALEGGRLSAQVEIDTRPEVPEIRLRPVFDLESLGAALSPWGLDSFLDGRGGLEMDLVSRGLQADEFLSALSGTGTINLQEGLLMGLDLEALVSGIQAGDIGRAASGAVGGNTRFENLGSSLEIVDGQLNLPDLRLAFGGYALGGPAVINLADLSLQGSLRFDQGRLERIPIGLSGSLTSPRVRLDTDEAVRGEIERRLLDVFQRRAGNEDENRDNGPDS